MSNTSSGNISAGLFNSFRLFFGPLTCFLRSVETAAALCVQCFGGRTVQSRRAGRRQEDAVLLFPSAVIRRLQRRQLKKPGETDSGENREGRRERKETESNSVAVRRERGEQKGGQ